MIRALDERQTTEHVVFRRSTSTDIPTQFAQQCHSKVRKSYYNPITGSPASIVVG